MFPFWPYYLYLFMYLHDIGERGLVQIMSEKLVLIDGHSILNRAFYGVPDLSNAEGLHTNAIYGFLNILFKILEEEKAQYLIVAFDVNAPTFRHEIYEAYKGTRKPMPAELREQIPVMKEVLHAMGVLTLEKAGLEADDILGTVAKTAEKKGMEVALVSGDRDLLQIATEHIKIRIPKTKGSRTEIEDYYAKDVKEKYQVTPEQFIELKALMGDTADNIPGVPKVGEKTATELMVNYGSIEGIYAHIEEITKKSIHNTLVENRELADLSKVLATINVNAPVDFSMEQAKIGDLYTKEAYAYFTRLEFKNMLMRFEKGVSEQEAGKDFQMIADLETAEQTFAELLQEKKAAYQFIAEEKELLGLALSYGEKHVFIVTEGFVTEGYLVSKMQEILQVYRKKQQILATFDAKQGYPYFEEDDVSMIFDVKLAAYLLNPLKSEYTIEDVANEYLQIMLKNRAQLFGKKKLALAMEEQRGEFLTYVCFMSYTCFGVYEKLEKGLKESGMFSLFTELEMPLTYVLYSMERYGIIAKADALKEYSDRLTSKIDEVEKSIYEQVGEKFNINSPKQLGVILFEKMGCKGGKKTKTGYSTAADVLEKLAPDYPVVNDILEYRGLTKLKSTYADGLADYIEDDGRIHSNFNQMITATGRISSTEPNLQNIPMRMELGRMIRKVFVPAEGYEFMDADYSQIELRILAHMAEDKELIEDYKSGKDIHRITASKVFHVPMDEVTDLQRRNAKAVNFGVVYGISSFGLSQDLDISRKEAEKYIEQYFETYQGIKAFLDKVVSDAKEKGYTETMFGRRRPIPELASSNYMQRQFGERAAMNAPIQGTAADIMKIAMVNVYRALKKQKLKSRLIVQVHDELLIETAQEEEEAVRKILTDEMKNAAKLAVTLEIDLHTGKDWYEAK